MNRVEFAVERFKEGFRCSQAVLEAWAPELGLDPELARRIATPLAGGSGIGGECGALTGGFLVIGLKYGAGRVEDADDFANALSKARELTERFRSLHGALNCCELLGLDVFSEEGRQEFRAKDMKTTRCIGFVEDTMKVLEELMEPRA